eukprot:scaffold99033_cov33-Phaeocystis_antarctica.AAC.1
MGSRRPSSGVPGSHPDIPLGGRENEAFKSGCGRYCPHDETFAQRTQIMRGRTCQHSPPSRFCLNRPAQSRDLCSFDLKRGHLVGRPDQPAGAP